MRKLISTLAIGIAFATPLMAEDGYTTYAYDGNFEDATFSVENAIIGAGLVIDYVSHTGEMLSRTGPDVGSDVHLFDQADIFVFCSARLSRKMMEADPMNISQCPYGIFVADQNGEVVIGYRHYPAGIMQEVQQLLDGIAEEAASF